MQTKSIISCLKVILLTHFILITCQFAQAQSKYEQFNVTGIRTSTPRSSTCYDVRIGHYACLEVGVVILYKTAAGQDSSISTVHKIDGTYVSTIISEFGIYKRMYFESLKANGFLGKVSINNSLQITPEIRQLLEQFVDQINQYENAIDLISKPDEIYNQQAIRTLYEITEAFINAGSTPDEQKQFVVNNQNVFRTLIEISKVGLDISVSLLPFINDARDLYEVISGRDVVSGEPIDSFGRVLSGLGLIAGNGTAYRRAILKIQDGLPRKVLSDAAAGIPKLRYTGNGSWVSEAGLIYVGKANKENRLRHVLKHAVPNPAKVDHTVFSTANKKEIPTLIDQAWSKRGIPLPGDPGVYIVDMGAIIGTKGEKRVRIVVKPGTSELVTAYPWN